MLKLIGSSLARPGPSSVRAFFFIFSCPACNTWRVLIFIVAVRMGSLIINPFLGIFVHRLLERKSFWWRKFTKLHLHCSQSKASCRTRTALALTKKNQQCLDQPHLSQPRSRRRSYLDLRSSRAKDAPPKAQMHHHRVVCVALELASSSKRRELTLVSRRLEKLQKMTADRVTDCKGLYDLCLLYTSPSPRDA